MLCPRSCIYSEVSFQCLDGLYTQDLQAQTLDQFGQSIVYAISEWGQLNTLLLGFPGSLHWGLYNRLDTFINKAGIVRKNLIPVNELTSFQSLVMEHVKIIGTRRLEDRKRRKEQ